VPLPVIPDALYQGTCLPEARARSTCPYSRTAGKLVSNTMSGIVVVDMKIRNLFLTLFSEFPDFLSGKKSRNIMFNLYKEIL
jgi:hypothetical protein